MRIPLQPSPTNLPPKLWSRRTALDPKHRPQVPECPSSTVRREWARAPQEAHVLDRSRERIRRLSACEIARIQGFDTEWIAKVPVSEPNVIRALGDAVPPPLAAALLKSIISVSGLKKNTFLEICAGAGGLTSGIRLQNLECIALVENWPPALEILRNRHSQYAKAIYDADVRQFPFSAFRNQIGILLGGPPCQPWSRAGRSRGALDERDLMGIMPQVLCEVHPDAFVFENVPGLLTPTHTSYFTQLMERLRTPDSAVRYAVLAGVLNAADFGIPQVRRRMFIIGLKGAAHKDVARVFDHVENARAYLDPARWLALENVLEPESEASGWCGWPYGSISARQLRFRQFR